MNNSDIILVYHGSDHIIQAPVYLGGRMIMIMEMDFIQQNMRSAQKTGLL